MSQKFDVVVIGSGPGGYVAALRAAKLGLKTACVEKDETLGGTCLNVGCIPSKSLLQSTESLSWLQTESAMHGINCSTINVDFPKMMERKKQIVSGLVAGIGSLFKANNVTRFKGTARFTSPTTIEITQGNDKETVEAKSFILATGSEPIPLPFLPFDEKTVVSSTGVLSLPTIPKSMIVIGGGVISVELASVYKRLGTDVTIIEMLDRICPGVDLGLSKALLQILKKQGINFNLSAKVVHAEKQDGKTVLDVQIGNETKKFSANVVLVAIGRRAYSKGLGLEEIGVKLNRGMVEVDKSFRTSLPNIYAIGDLIDGPMLAHKASEEGYVVAEIIAGHKASVNYMAIPSVVYTHPEVASVGMTEEEVRAAGLEPVIGVCSFRGNARARCAGDSEGFVKVIGVGPNKRLAGMHIIGPHASELIAEGLIAIEKQATLEEIANSCHAHPTLAESIKEACGQALGIAVHI